ncbi:hypothetical protein L873DRAFT_1729464 [Choiromyces venosus 120613-1]|uniref:Uncharacterized protein n=1 Tax=Choiromyces venosus 120613-1 TaxID=1336337 RepID=A0A3N4K176_9PEZI|nr:hypothetical protein L873DRAFT_1729464 [Choiromyces venosus 120613-1]
MLIIQIISVTGLSNTGGYLRRMKYKLETVLILIKQAFILVSGGISGSSLLI